MKKCSPEEIDWTPFREGTKASPDEIREISRQIAKDLSMDEACIERLVERESAAKVFLNNIYQVKLCDDRDVIWLSIKRHDKAAIHDWRHFQRIKNELVGPENEAVEIYPAESRLIDTANQYHLWVFKDPTYRLPLGFNEGRKTVDAATAEKIGAKQRGR